MLLGLDSTDSLRGGCTTHVAWEIWSRLEDFGVQGGPRLVRLNPNIPHKTRGNGALCLDLGHGRGRRRLAGISSKGRELWAYETVDPLDAQECRDVVDVARATIDELRATDDPKAQPGLVATNAAPPEVIYRRTVEAIVDAPRLDGTWQSHSWNGGRGLIGAVAATAWRPVRGSYELIAYRRSERWGTPRRIPLEVGPALDAAVLGSFDNWDARHGHLRVAPSSPCPVLAGVRGTVARELPKALELLDVEPAAGWLTFVTNQATGDHLVERAAATLAPCQGAVLEGILTGDPERRRGGHVRIRLQDASGAVDAFAFEPTKEFRDDVVALRAGDEVRLEASTHADPGVVSIEAVETLRCGPRTHLDATCPRCGGRGRSKGRRSGHACQTCGNRFVPGPRVEGSATVRKERVAVPVAVRRHLALPPGIDDRTLQLAPGGIAA